MTVKVVVLITRKTDIELADFRQAWHRSNPPRVATIPGLLRYRQTPTIVGNCRSRRYDGMAELWFDSIESLRAGLDSLEAEAVRQHEESFIGQVEWFIAGTSLDFQAPFSSLVRVGS